MVGFAGAAAAMAGNRRVREQIAKGNLRGAGRSASLSKSTQGSSEMSSVKLSSMFSSMKTKASTAVAAAGAAAKQGVEAAKGKLEAVRQAAPSLPGAGESSEAAAVKQLVLMGFDKVDAQKALQSTNFDLEDAVARLCEEEAVLQSAAQRDSESNSTATPSTSQGEVSEPTASEEEDEKEAADAVAARRAEVLEATERRMAAARASTRRTMEEYRRQCIEEERQAAPKPRPPCQEGHSLMTSTEALLSRTWPQDPQTFDAQLQRTVSEEELAFQRAIAASLGVESSSAAAAAVGEDESTPGASSSSSWLPPAATAASSSSSACAAVSEHLPLPGTDAWDVALDEPTTNQLEAVATFKELFAPPTRVSGAEQQQAHHEEEVLHTQEELEFLWMPSVGTWLLPAPAWESPANDTANKQEELEMSLLDAADVDEEDQDQMLTAEPRRLSIALGSNIQLEINLPERRSATAPEPNPETDAAEAEADEVDSVDDEDEDSQLEMLIATSAKKVVDAGHPTASSSRLGQRGGA
eukprot:TRINITY_DN12944_c0_g1_i2.p1 TRINITY_DN12944_c0_g1~~TRINITY_DN12944_c0_g1_i2.p1  ORF type:complete len:526 (-),score=188.03 TRINITY_DN12944_c0_g1_i2:350-1927(-)